MPASSRPRTIFAMLLVFALALSSLVGLGAAPAHAATQVDLTGGTVRWGIEASYYGSFASNPQYTKVTAPATAVTNAFEFPVSSSGSSWDGANGVVAAHGAVQLGYTFAGGNYVSVADPVISIDGDSGTLSAVTAGAYHGYVPTLPSASRQIATLDFGAVTPVITSTSITWTEVPVSLTEAGTTFLYDIGSGSSYAQYEVGAQVQPITVSIGFAEPSAQETTIGLTTAPRDSAQVGESVTLSASVVPSTATGSVQFSVDGEPLGDAVPVEGGTAELSTTALGLGEHELTAAFTPDDPTNYLSSESESIEYTITDAAPTDPTNPPVDGGQVEALTDSLNWGFRAGWRGYIASGGSVTVGSGAKLANAAQGALSTILWPAGQASFDVATGAGDAQFSGSARYRYPTHGIDLTLSNPRVVLNGDGTGSIYWTIEGASDTAVTRTEVRGAAIGSISYGTPVANDGVTTTTVTASDVAITGAGGAAFSYNVGDSLDGFTLTFSVKDGATAVTPPPVASPAEPTNPGDSGKQSTGGSGSKGFTKTSSAAGSLTWGVKASFRSYITGSIAKGTISVSDGAQSSGGLFRFAQSSSGSYDVSTRTGGATYRGAVTFFGHGGALNITLANPRVSVNGSSGTLYVTVGGRELAIAQLTLPRPATTNGAATFTGASVALTTAGAQVFEGYYGAGEVLDPVTFTIGSAARTASTSATVASFQRATWAAPETPGATTGLTIEGDDDIQPGSSATVTGSGFDPNEEGIRIAVYSTPQVLTSTVTADASGAISWTGALPSNLEPGEHTIVAYGANNTIGAVFTVADAESLTVQGCSITDATLTWGFKDSWRSYIDGSIANGEWTVSDGAKYETPNFSWTSTTGAYDVDSVEAEIPFTGSIHFTGHDGALDMTVANPVLRIADASTGYLVLDVSSVQLDGSVVDESAANFAKLDLSGVDLTPVNGTVTLTDVPATLTAEGASAFSGYYNEGEELDPITLVFTVGTDCAVAEGADDSEASPSATAVAGVSTDAGAPTWLWWVIGLAVLIAAAGGTIAVVRSNKRPTEN